MAVPCTNNIDLGHVYRSWAQSLESFTEGTCFEELLKLFFFNKCNHCANTKNIDDQLLSLFTNSTEISDFHNVKFGYRGCVPQEIWPDIHYRIWRVCRKFCCAVCCVYMVFALYHSGRFNFTIWETYNSLDGRRCINLIIMGHLDISL